MAEATVAQELAASSGSHSAKPENAHSTLFDLIGNAFTALNQYKALAACGWVSIGLVLVMIVFAGLDERMVTGANPWLKPIKYAISISLYTWTLSMVLGMIEDFAALRAVVAKAVAALMLVEICAVSIQAARGVESHYNILSGFDRWNFAALGSAAALNTVFASMVLALILTSARPDVAPGLIWGVRVGLVLFVAANFQGVQMILHQSHTVGAEDGTAGIPFLNWSTSRGDLRTAHVFGLFALQILPALGWLIGRTRASATIQTAGAILAGLGYGALTFWLNRIAMSGRPLF